ncbi:MAG: hypothetical protein AAB460_02465 [Patescibacteria group bacterium]
MRRNLTLASIVLVLAAVFSMTAPLNAHPEQGSTDGTIFHCPDGTHPYMVRLGDTLWSKQGEAWRTGWPKLVEQNRHLRLENRRKDYTADDIRVMLYRGDYLCNLAESGFTVGTATSEILVTKDAEPPATPIAANRPTLSVLVRWILAGLLVLFALVVLFLWNRQRREQMKHPATLGPPMATRGIEHLTPEQVASYVDNLAGRRFKGDRVGNPERVRLLGRWRFNYNDGQSRVGICSGRDEDRAYRAVYTIPGRKPNVEVFTLLACGNDGNTTESLGGTWTHDPLPQPAPAPVAPVVRTWGLAEYRGWLKRMVDGGIQITRRRLHLHLNNLVELFGFRIVVLEDISREMERLSNEQARWESTALLQRQSAEALRSEAAAKDAAAEDSLRVARGAIEKRAALQFDINMFTPRPAPEVPPAP